MHRAAQYCRRSGQGVRVTAKPTPGQVRQGTVLAKVVSAGINPVDAKFVICDKLPTWIQPLVRPLVDGRTPGFDFSGVVVQAPPGSPFKHGDAVFGTVPPFAGSLQEYVLAPVDQIALKPPGLTFNEAASLPLVGITAMQALKEDNGLRQGHRLLVIGASGGVGHVAVQVGRALGASVTGVCSSKNAEFVLHDCGADVVVEYDGSVPLMEVLKQQAAACGPFDLVLDCVSSHDPRDMAHAYEETIRAAVLDDPALGDAMGGQKLLQGKYVCIGGFFWSWVAAGLKRTIGIDLFSPGRELFWIRFPRSSELLAELGGMAAKGRLKHRVGRVLPFTNEGVQEAFRLLNERRMVGKVVVAVAPEADSDHENATA